MQKKRNVRLYTLLDVRDQAPAPSNVINFVASQKQVVWMVTLVTLKSQREELNEAG